MPCSKTWGVWEGSQLVSLSNEHVASHIQWMSCLFLRNLDAMASEKVTLNVKQQLSFLLFLIEQLSCLIVGFFRLRLRLRLHSLKQRELRCRRHHSKLSRTQSRSNNVDSVLHLLRIRPLLERLRQLMRLLPRNLCLTLR